MYKIISHDEDHHALYYDDNHIGSYKTKEEAQKALQNIGEASLSGRVKFKRRLIKRGSKPRI